MNVCKKTLVALVIFVVVFSAMPPDGTNAAAIPRPAQEDYAPLSDSDLDALVAPIALYPDALVAQILGASTYPDQVAEAETFLKANYNLTGQALMDAVDAKPWDPSVQAIVQFPSVLDMLAKNIEWTSELGDASANRQADVMAAIQRMRAKAYAAGNLKTGDQIKVVKESPNVIVIQPSNPQVIYVPTYNPTVVYGAPVVTPGYSSGDLAAAAIISFGAGIAIGAALSGGSSCGWRYSSWGMNWSTRAVYCGGGAYYGNPYWWGGYYPGYYPGYRAPYYPPPRPPRPPPPGWRPPPSYPPGRPPVNNPGRPPRPTPLPSPAPGRPTPNPGRPTIQPVPTPNPGRPTPTPGRPTPAPGRPNPGNPTIQPAPNPGNPTIQPVPGPGGTPGTRPTPGTPTTRPAPGVPGRQPTPTRESRGYPSTNAKPAVQPNVFSGTVGGRPESSRGNRSMNPPPAAARPSGSAPQRPGGGAPQRSGGNPPRR
jgi:Protein of unknown function (DUF3300)